MSDREPVLAEGLPLSLIWLKVIDSLPLGVNARDLEPGSLFPGVGSGGRGSVKGKGSGGVDVMVMIMPEVE